MTDIVSIEAAAERRKRLECYGAEYIAIADDVFELCQLVDLCCYVYGEELGRPMQISDHGPTAGYALRQARECARQLMLRIGDKTAGGEPAA